MVGKPFDFGKALFNPFRTKTEFDPDHNEVWLFQSGGFQVQRLITAILSWVMSSIVYPIPPVP